MTEIELDAWFDNLDSSNLANIFPSEFEHTMMSADPDVNINTFYQKVEAEWKRMSPEEKQEVYHEFHP